MLLAGDIGGTKTTLAIFSQDDHHQPHLEAETTFKSANYASLERIIEEFLADKKEIKLQKAAFGVAGPVVGGQSQITNLPWLVSEKDLQKRLNLSIVKIINDLEAIAQAVPHFSPNDLVSLNQDQMDTQIGGNKAVIAPGTGLGQAVLFEHQEQFYISPSEGGHVDFAPRNSLEIELLLYLKDEFNHVSYERICSGSGMPNIYKFLVDTEYGQVSPNPEVAEAIQQAKDPTPVIVQAGMNNRCKICQITLNTFLSILGAEAGNLALKVMATGGIYLGGGIPPKILPKLQEQAGFFMPAFVNKGRFTQMLTKIPVYVILNDQAALLGAASYGINL